MYYLILQDGFKRIDRYKYNQTNKGFKTVDEAYNKVRELMDSIFSVKETKAYIEYIGKNKEGYSARITLYKH